MKKKKEMIASFLWKIHKSKHKRFLKRKKNVHLEGERNERFPWMPKWAWMFAWLDKQSNRWNTGLIWMGKQTLSLSVCMATKPYVWVSTWMCAMINFAWISNYHNMRFMEMIWAFPYSEPFAKQISRHKSCPAICMPFEPNVNFLAITLT